MKMTMMVAGEAWSGEDAFDMMLDLILVWLEDVGQVFKCQVS